MFCSECKEPVEFYEGSGRRRDICSMMPNPSALSYEPSDDVAYPATCPCGRTFGTFTIQTSSCGCNRYPDSLLPVNEA